MKTKYVYPFTATMFIALNGCGFTTGPNGWTIGTTGYLAESNKTSIGSPNFDYDREPMDNHTLADKLALQRELDGKRKY